MIVFSTVIVLLNLSKVVGCFSGNKILQSRVLVKFLNTSLSCRIPSTKIPRAKRHHRSKAKAAMMNESEGGKRRNMSARTVKPRRKNIIKITMNSELYEWVKILKRRPLFKITLMAAGGLSRTYYKYKRQVTPPPVGDDETFDVLAAIFVAPVTS